MSFNSIPIILDDKIFDKIYAVMGSNPFPDLYLSKRRNTDQLFSRRKQISRVSIPRRGNVNFRFLSGQEISGSRHKRIRIAISGGQSVGAPLVLGLVLLHLLVGDEVLGEISFEVHFLAVVDGVGRVVARSDVVVLPREEAVDL